MGGDVIIILCCIIIIILCCGKTTPLSGIDHNTVISLDEQLNSLPAMVIQDPGITTILRASLVIGNFYDFCPFLAFDN